MQPTVPCRTSRRRFLQATAAAVAAPAVLAGRRAGADANSEITVAAIGVGGSRTTFGRGGKIGQNAAKLGKMIAVCDVDLVNAGQFNDKLGGKLKVFQDYRKMFDQLKPDVVTIGTPDHWHVAIAIAAMRAGCDVYCEKPLTLTIEEGIQICRVVKQTGKVFQVGSQQRTECGQRFLKAIAIAQSGRLGDNLRAQVAIGGAPSGGPFENGDPPEGLDWDLWLGPTPKVPYCTERNRLFRWWYEYSGGKMTDWGAHHIDIAQWALGCDKTGPSEVQGTAVFPEIIPQYDPVAFFAGKVKLPNGFNTPTEFHINLKYANGTAMSVNNKYDSPSGDVSFPNGILLEGDAGRIFVNRGRLSGKPVEEMTDADKKWLDEEVIKLYGGKQPTSHMENFFNCVRDRSQPISDVFTHHRTMTTCHLCNITLQLGRKLNWDPEGQKFIGDKQADALISRPRRKGYELDA